MVAKVLIVDDEAPLVKNLASYLRLFDQDFEVLTAGTGEEALTTLEEEAGIDVLLTDVRLPGIDGIEVVRQAVALNRSLRVLVMTAYPSQEIRRAASAVGALQYLEKPLDLKRLRERLQEALNTQAGWSGKVGGLDIFDFTQLFAMSGKTGVVRVAWGDETGHLVFDSGTLVHASCGKLGGDAAFYRLTNWRGGTFEEQPQHQSNEHEQNIVTPTGHLMMEAARLRDEERRDGAVLEGDAIRSALGQGVPAEDVQPTEGPEGPEEGTEMAIKDLLTEFESIEGFRGVGVFSSQGEMLDGIAKSDLDIKTVGTFANNALLNAQKATDAMGVGRGNMMTLRAPEATVMMRCLNEATDFAATKAGKAHFHTVVVMAPESNTGMAAMVLDKVVTKIADEVR